MKTNVKQTSRQTYSELKDSGYLSEKEQQIMAAFQGGHTFTRQQLVHAAGMDINGVCGRVNALLAKGVLEVCGVTYDGSTRKPREVLKKAAQ